MAGQVNPVLPVLTTLPHGSHTALLVNPAIKGKARTALIETARAPNPSTTSRPGSCG